MNIRWAEYTYAHKSSKSRLKTDAIIMVFKDQHLCFMAIDLNHVYVAILRQKPKIIYFTYFSNFESTS